jgi:hypothetical protein
VLSQTLWGFTKDHYAARSYTRNGALGPSAFERTRERHFLPWLQAMLGGAVAAAAALPHLPPVVAAWRPPAAFPAVAARASFTGVFMASARALRRVRDDAWARIDASVAVPAGEAQHFLERAWAFLLGPCDDETCAANGTACFDELQREQLRARRKRDADERIARSRRESDERFARIRAIHGRRRRVKSKVH